MSLKLVSRTEVMIVTVGGSSVEVATTGIETIVHEAVAPTLGVRGVEGMLEWGDSQLLQEASIVDSIEAPDEVGVLIELVI